MSDSPLLLPTWPDSIDMTFNAPLEVVNAELFSVLRMWAQQTGYPLHHEQTAGAVGYTVRLPSGLVCLIDVLSRGQDLTTVRVQHPWRYDPFFLEEMQQYVANAFTLFERDHRWCTAVLHRCERQIVQAMRYRKRAFTLDPEVFPPPLPQWDSSDAQLQRDAIMYKDVYFPTMPDREYAVKLGIDHGSLRNARSRLKLPARPSLEKAVQRGRKRRDKK